MPNEVCHTSEEALKATVEELEAELSKRRAVNLSRCSLQELEDALAQKQAALASEESPDESYTGRRRRKPADEATSE